MSTAVLDESKVETKVFAQTQTETRWIGIRHRVKQTAEGKPSPTQVHIADKDGGRLLELDDEQDELDFVFGIMPTGFRDVLEGEDLSCFKPHHVVTKGKGDKKRTQVPSGYEGLFEGDVVGTILGGSGDYLAYAIAVRCEKIGAKIFRIPPARLKDNRPEGEKDKTENDASLLARLVRENREEFYPVFVKDKDQILCRILYATRRDAMKDRIRCEQRLYRRVIGETFCSAEGLYPQGGLEKLFDLRKANDGALKVLVAEEEEAIRKLEKEALPKIAMYTEVLSKIDGLGPLVGARLANAIQDIRRFPTEAKLMAYLGVHLRDGKFPRQRHGAQANWSGEGRQGFYLFSDQFSIWRPKSVWGQYFERMKAGFRTKHPQVELVDGANGKKVKKYTDGHIHKMARWRTMTRCCRRIFKDLWKLERGTLQVSGDGQALS